MFTPNRRAFFYPWPILRQPGADKGFIAFSRAWQGLLPAPAKCVQQTRDVVDVVADPKLPFDQLVHPVHRPALGGETGGNGPTFQLPHQSLPFGTGQARRAPAGFAAPQGPHSALLELMRPLPNGCTAHSQPTTNLRLRQFPDFQQSSRRATSLFHLLSREVFRNPFHASQCKAI